MKITSLVALLSIGLSSTPAMAGKLKVVGDIITQSVELVFNSPFKLSLELIPKKNLNAGLVSDNTVAFDFNINVDSNNSARIGLRFTPKTGQVKDVSTEIVPGKVEGNSINLKIKPTSKYVKNQDWIMTGDEVIWFKGEVAINGDQVIQPDTYVVSMDAAVFKS